MNVGIYDGIGRECCLPFTLNFFRMYHSVCVGFMERNLLYNWS